MSLRLPLRSQMKEPLDDAAIERVWRGVRARRGKRSPSPKQAFLLAAAALATLSALVVMLLGRSPVDRGPLLVVGGGAVAAFAANEEARSIALSDGSHIDLGRGAELRTRENTGRTLEVLLRGGSATFDVRPGGPRRWTIDCGLAKVEVKGTRFSIDAQSASVAVKVERGRVAVTSAEGTRELGAGDAIDVRAEHAAEKQSAPEPLEPPAPSAPEPMATAAADAAAAPAPRAAPPATTKPSAQTEPWRELAQQGDFAAAYATLGAKGIAIATPVAGVDELLALADVARLSGHPADAVAPLSRVVDEHASDPRAPLAAFTLGRIQFDALGQPARAADAFARAVALGLPTSLAEDGYARLVEARAKAGDRTGANAALEAYERAFPRGNRSTTMRRWIAGSEGPQSPPSPSP